jgi:hypothetical protein
MGRRWVQVQSTMRPVLVVVADVLAKHCPEVALVDDDDDERVEAFAAEGPMTRLQIEFDFGLRNGVRMIRPRATLRMPSK